MGKFAGLVMTLLLIHEVMLLHSAMAARELPSSVMAAVDDRRRLVNIIQTDRTKPTPPTPKPNIIHHFYPPLHDLSPPPPAPPRN